MAIELLNRFGDKTNSLKGGGKKLTLKPSTSSTNHSNNHNLPKPFPAITTTQHQNQSPVPYTLNNRNLIQARNRISQSPSQQTPNALDKTTTYPSTPVVGMSSSSSTAPKTPLSNNPTTTTTARAYVSPYGSGSSANYQLQYRTQVKTPFPIINQNEKKFFDRILDFLMGEGQSSQYGMVCKECYGHNGILFAYFD